MFYIRKHNRRKIYKFKRYKYVDTIRNDLTSVHLGKKYAEANFSCAQKSLALAIVIRDLFREPRI